MRVTGRNRPRARTALNGQQDIMPCEIRQFNVMDK
jgi:hypothetical protein